ncbi:MAG: Beta-ketoacyl synthase, partial [Rhizobacter sp.]|nr:Beta-ketoacyl synthase [Rhizobacter sp.]
VPAAMPNACAAHVAMRLGVKGPVITYAVACASGSIAIAEAAHAIARGEIDVAIAGGAESVLSPGSLAAWQALQTLAKPSEGDASASCRPFSRDRDGLVLGEGAAFLILESAEHARRRDRDAYARLAGSAVRCDASHLTRPHVDGQASTLRAALAMSGMEPTRIGWCNAHGTATTTGDPVECAALRTVWGDDWRQLPISATKSMHGHLLGAGGALEAAISVMALTERAVPPTAHVRAEDIDEACEMNHVLGRGVEMPGLDAVLSNSFAFGGTNAVLVFARVERIEGSSR